MAAGRIKIPVVLTGVPNLDAVLGGGLPELSVTVLAGPAGSGKTTLAQQVSFHTGTRKRPAVYFATLGEPVVKILRYQQQFSFFDPAKVGSAVHFVDIGRETAEGGAKGALEVIARHVQELSPGLVVIDSFRAMDDVSASGMERRVFMHELAQLLAGWQCTSLLVGEYGEQEVGVGAEFTVADNVVFLTQEQHHNAVVRRLWVVKVRGQASQPGKHAFRILESGLEVYPRTLQVSRGAKRRKGARASTGIVGLDEMTRGGLPRGQACLLAGSSGTGKTLMALHFVVAGAQAGEPCVVATFEESPAEHVEKMAAFGWDLPALERDGLIRMVYMRPVDLSFDEVTYAIDRAVGETKARRVVINSISGMEVALPQTDRAELREGLYRLTANLTARGVVVMLTIETPDIFGGFRLSEQGLSFLADNAIMLRYVEIDGEIRRAVMVVKMRTSAHDNALREYTIGPKGIVVDEPFSDFSGILTGVPTRSAVPEARALTTGLGADERALVGALHELQRASARELARALGAEVGEVRRMLGRLEEESYVVRTGAGKEPSYRVALLAQPGPRSGRRRE